MINDIAHARSYARDLKRQLKTTGIGHLAAHDMAARTLGLRDWRTLSMTSALSSTREEVATRLTRELACIDGLNADAVVTALLPPVGAVPEPQMPVEPRRPHYDNSKIIERPIALLNAFNGKQLDNIYHAMRMEHRGLGVTMTKRMEECLKQGFFPRPSVQDLIEDCDHRLQIDKMGMRIDRLMDCLGYSWTNMTHRPLASAKSAAMFQAISPAKLTGFLIMLERMGFKVPAVVMVEQLLPEMKKRKVLNPDELSIFWYARERDRFHLRFVADDVDRANKHDEGRLANGYWYEAMIKGDQVGSLEIYGSRYRRGRFDW